jgi:division protein CdvB (Snf7/Vps24/ESCRT-III family)
MAKKPRRAVVQKILKNLLDSEIPEIQSTANRLAEQIKDLEEHSSRLQEHIAQIENLATDEANALSESQLTDILKDLDGALGELKKRTKKALPARAEAAPSPPAKRAVILEKPEPEEEAEVEEVEELEEITPGQGMRLETYTTPEGYLIKKSRI